MKLSDILKSNKRYFSHRRDLVALPRTKSGAIHIVYELLRTKSLNAHKMSLLFQVHLTDVLTGCFLRKTKFHSLDVRYQKAILDLQIALRERLLGELSGKRVNWKDIAHDLHRIVLSTHINSHLLTVTSSQALVPTSVLNLFLKKMKVTMRKTEGYVNFNSFLSAIPVRLMAEKSNKRRSSLQLHHDKKSLQLSVSPRRLHAMKKELPLFLKHTADEKNVRKLQCLFMSWQSYDHAFLEKALLKCPRRYSVFGAPRTVLHTLFQSGDPAIMLLALKAFRTPKSQAALLEALVKDNGRKGNCIETLLTHCLQNRNKEYSDVINYLAGIMHQHKNTHASANTKIYRLLEPLEHSRVLKEAIPSKASVDSIIESFVHIPAA